MVDTFFQGGWQHLGVDCRIFKNVQVSGKRKKSWFNEDLLRKLVKESSEPGN